ncbi:MAG: trypsin-like serine protease [Cyanobacteria bacterium P01_D01_bin.1]
MIIRHDVDPNLYMIAPEQFSAIIAVDSSLEEVLVTYDQIDELLKPSLVASVQPEPEFYTRCDGMGTLIRPDWILSAAHVAAEISLERKIEIAGSAYAIRQIVLHPQFCDCSEAVGLAEYDIALIQLEQPVEAITPLPLYRNTDESGKTVTFAGRGDCGTGLIGPNQVDGKLRIATNRIEQVDEQRLMFTFDAPPNCTALEGISGPGDSGGPALIETGGGWAIAGVSSGQKSSNLGEGCYGVQEYYVRVSSQIEWIESVIG